MLALKNFLQYGVAWQGGTDDIEYMQTRAARVLLLSLADQISARNPYGGVKTGRPGLTGFTYKKSTVAAVLARFIRLGILTRQRAPRHGGRHEDFATTVIAPLLIEHANEWQRAGLALKKAGKRGVNARPEKAALQIPLISTVPTGEPILARLGAGERPDIGPISVQKLDTISIFTPPLSIVPVPHLSPDQADPCCDFEPVLPTPHAVGGRDALASSCVRPFFSPEDIRDFRRFSAWLLSVNKSDALTSIQLIKPSQRGRLEVFANKTSGTSQRNCGLTSVEPEQVFKLAYAKSKDVFEKCGEGEQVFFAPRPGSRVILMDDLKTDQAVFPGTPVVILETSHGNYQHFYVCERGLTVGEQGQMQAAMARKFGADVGATGGGQPHRCPGSINYKSGRGLFVTRLVQLCSAGRPIPFLTSPATRAQVAGVQQTTPSSNALASSKSRSLDASSNQSGADWAWVKTNRHLGFDALVTSLAARSTARGKHADYARRTVEKALST